MDHQGVAGNQLHVPDAVTFSHGCLHTVQPHQGHPIAGAQLDVAGAFADDIGTWGYDDLSDSCLVGGQDIREGFQLEIDFKVESFGKVPDVV